MFKRAIVAGASGLTGESLLKKLLDKPGYNEVLILVRRELPLIHKKLKQLVVDFDNLDQVAGQIYGDAFFCSLGSTKRKTPDLNDYRKVDHDYPLKLAIMARDNGIGQYHLVSSIGANPDSSNFYTRMKGETEKDITAVGLKCLHIYRPSALNGNRKENRALEKLSVWLLKVLEPLLVGRLKKYRTIAAQTVADVMYKQSLKNETGVHIYSSDKIEELS